MRKHLTSLLAAASLLSLAFAPAPLPKPPRALDAQDDLKKLQGAWSVIAGPTGKGRQPKDDMQVVFAGNRMTFRRGGAVVTDWTITLNAKATPKGIDMKRVFPVAPLTILAVYGLDGDTFQF